VLYAEASPLPGHSSDSLETVIEAMDNLSAPSHAGRLPPALRFALDSFSLALRPAEHFNPVGSNALLAWQGMKATSESLARAAHAGYSVFKLKLYPENARELPEFLREQRHPGRKFRLDANRSLNQDEAADFLAQIARLGLTDAVDYIEEPYSGFWDAPVPASVPIAADESLDSAESIFRLLDSPHSPAAFVLKPTVLGSLTELGEIMTELRSAGKRAVVTSTFESEVGRRSLIQFLAGQTNEETHGISTGFLFRENFLPDQAEFASLPAPAPAESAWLSSLVWRECR
jgi:O-succinylbenzoate synthase